MANELGTKCRTIGSFSGVVAPDPEVPVLTSERVTESDNRQCEIRTRLPSLSVSLPLRPASSMPRWLCNPPHPGCSWSPPERRRHSTSGRASRNDGEIAVRKYVLARQCRAEKAILERFASPIRPPPVKCRPLLRSIQHRKHVSLRNWLLSAWLPSDQPHGDPPA
jgi:hypothetical protein